MQPELVAVMTSSHNSQKRALVRDPAYETLDKEDSGGGDDSSGASTVGTQDEDPLATSGRVACRMPNDPLRYWPIAELQFDMFFFRQLFDVLHRRGIARKDKVHVTVLHNMSVRLADLISLNGMDPSNKFFARGRYAHKSWFSWKDVCKELLIEGTPQVHLMPAETIYMTLEDATTSMVARIYSLFMQIVIFGNLTLIFLSSMPKVCDELVADVLFHHDGPDEKCGCHFQHACLIIFSIDYFVKLVCSPFIRFELFDTELLMSQTIPEDDPTSFGEATALSRLGRLWHFVSSPMNIVDLISIAPYWLKFVIGELLPANSTSFLRILRVFRIIRILKTGRYVQTLLVLFKTLARTVSAMVVLIIFVALVAVVAGVILQQVESSFESVPHATYWVFARLIAMKPSDISGSALRGTITTIAGVCTFAVVVSFKGILWILPIGQIKSAFDDEAAKVCHAQKMRREMTYELTRPDWTSWYGLQSSCRARLEFWPGAELGAPVAWAAIPIPILMCRSVSAKLDIPIPEGSIKPMCGQQPSVTVNIEWFPSYEMGQRDPALPLGRLKIHLLQGMGFASHSKKQPWVCRITVPDRFCGESVDSRSMVSACGGPKPDFSQSVEFEVDWVTSESQDSALLQSKEPSYPAGVPTPTASPSRSDDELEFRRRTLALLEEQGRRLNSLEQLLQERSGAVSFE